MLGASPKAPGRRSTGSAEVLAGFERREAGVAARRQPLCRVEPGTVGFRDPVNSIFQTLGLLPGRALSWDGETVLRREFGGVLA
jgi:hypothetical protein